MLSPIYGQSHYRARHTLIRGIKVCVWQRPRRNNHPVDRMDTVKKTAFIFLFFEKKKEKKAMVQMELNPIIITILYTIQVLQKIKKF